MSDYQEQLEKLLNLEQLQETVKGFYDAESLSAKIQENVQLASKLIAANTAAASDAMIMQSVKLRDGVETALKQADTLANCKDLGEAVESQKSFGEQSKDTLVNQAWMNIGLAVNALESNIEIIKNAGQAAKASSKKA